LVINPRLSTLLGQLFEAMESTHSVSQIEGCRRYLAYSPPLSPWSV